MTEENQGWRQLLSKDFSPENPYSKYSASVLETSTDAFETHFVPLEKDKDYDYEEKVTRRYNSFERKDMRMALAKNAYDLANSFKSTQFEVVAFSWQYQVERTEYLVQEDFKFVGLTMIACLIYMTVHTKSFYLGFTSLMTVCMSIPISLCIYSFICRIPYFESLHLSIIIVIVGIGSDDVFVFHDAWKNAFTIKALKNRPVLRLSYTFR